MIMMQTTSPRPHPPHPAAWLVDLFASAGQAESILATSTKNSPTSPRDRESSSLAVGIGARLGRRLHTPRVLHSA